MLIKTRANSGLCALMVALFGAAAIAASPAAEDAGRTAAKPDARPQPIDTRITAMPGPQHGGRTRASIAPARIVVPRNLLGRPGALPSTAETVRRNAIGVAVAHREGLQQPNLAHAGLVPYRAAAGAIGGVSRTNGLLAKPGGPLARPAAHANPLAGPAHWNRGSINGTSLVRPGSSLSAVGGPAKSVAGIDGTAMRPKR